VSRHGVLLLPPWLQLDVEVLRADSTEHLTITLEASG
jgi:hypothetical protein